MKIVMLDGTVHIKTWCPANCTGYMAKSIELDARDLRIMRRMMSTDMIAFGAAMKQMEQRYEENRLSNVEEFAR